MAIDAFYKDRFALPIKDGSLTKSYNKSSHIGVDFGWIKTPYTDILAIQDGKVVEVDESSTMGHYIILQHDYSDGTHRWSGYIHLKSKPTLAEGTVVKQSQVIGVKGNTGKSNGVHLHIYVTACTKTAYSKSMSFWTGTFKPLCNFNPMPMFYRDRNVKYDQLGENGGVNKLKFLDELPPKIVYPEPIERNESVKQCKVIMDVLRLRNGAGTEFTAYEKFAKKGIYDVLEEKLDKAKAYVWYKIFVDPAGNEFWVASGGKRTEDLLVPKSKEEQLMEEVEALKNENSELKHSIQMLLEDQKAKEIVIVNYETKHSKILEVIKDAFNKVMEL